MMLLFLLLVATASVWADEDLDVICPSGDCWLYYNGTVFSAKLAPKIKDLELLFHQDLKILELTPNLNRLVMLGCSGINLEDVTPLEHLRSMTIFKAIIPQLHNDHFAQMPGLESLHLNDNSIESLSRGTFQNLSLLWDLELKGNLIKFLPDGLFYSLKNLERVDLRNNQISVITESTFAQNKRLNWLYLSGNPLTRLDFPTETPNWGMDVLKLDRCGQLKRLQLSFDVIELFLDNSGVESVQSNKSIESIVLTNSSLTHLSLRGSQSDQTFHRDIICKIWKLQWLDLSNTTRNIPLLDTIKSINGDCQLPNLKYLNLSRNHLVNLPLESPLFPTELSFIDLSHNKLEIIRLETFDRLRDLRSLRLEGNNLRSFNYHSLYINHRNLQELALYDNKFNSSVNNEIIQYFCHEDMQVLIVKDNQKLSGTECQDSPSPS